MKYIEGDLIRSSDRWSKWSVSTLLLALHNSYTAPTDGTVCHCDGCKSNRNGLRAEIERRTAERIDQP